MALVAFGACRREASRRRGQQEQAASAATPLQPVRVGIAIPSYVHALAWIARDGELFEAQGLRATVQVMGGSAATMRALIGGSTDVGLAGGDAVLKANQAGADLVIVAGFVNRFYHRLIVRREITSAADLRGKKVGLPFLGGPQDMAVRHALESLGLDYEKDVKVLSLGKEFNRMAAMKQGEIDATTSQTPASRLSELGFRVLVDLPASDAAFPYMMLVVARSRLERQRGQVKATLKALCAAVESYRDPERKMENLALLARELQGSDTRQAALERYASAGPGLLSYPPVPDARGFDLVLRYLPKKGAPLERTLEPGVLDELRKEGHCGGSPGP